MLEKVKLANNSLTGAIPNSWTDSSLLEHFDVSNNQLEGSLPDTLANLSKLKKLHLSNNLLKGTIPPSYYNMLSLDDFFIDRNTIGGSLSQLDKPLYADIQEFVINDNWFEGRFPAEQFEKNKNLSKYISRAWHCCMVCYIQYL